jgi:hypothetical protein
MRNWMRAMLAGGMLWWAVAGHAQVTPDPVNLTGLWYSEAEAGHGVNVAHQGSILFVAWYVYAADGKLLWLVSAATRQADGRYVGPIASFRGQPYNLINNTQANTQDTPRGEVRVALGSDGRLDFGYTIDGITQTRRFDKAALVADPTTCTFTTASRAGATNYTDVWWRASESGWGTSIVHQGDAIFIAWYTYGSDGNPMWVTGFATRQADGSFVGDLARPANGVPFNQITGLATTFPVPLVGTFALTFSDGENASFRYTLDGITQTKAITRLVYVGAEVPKTVCATSTGGGTPGVLSSCDPGLNAGDFRTAFFDNGNGEITERVVGPATFQGQNVILVEQFDAQNTITGRSYLQVTASEILTLATEGFQNGQVALTTVYNPPAKFRRVPAVNETYTHSYVGTSNGSGLSYTTQYQETIKREADDPEDVPAGSFNACKFKRDIVTTTFGITQTINMELWLAPQVGTIRSRSLVPTPVGTTEVESELRRARVNGVSYPN